MDFYDEEKNVESYVQMAEGYDGRELVDVLKKHLTPGSTVLELGMGPGKNMALLAEAFAATGSDRSEVFLRRYRRDHPDADVLLLDAVTMETERRFDAIYSNKVLHHLRMDELRKSLRLQEARVNGNSLVLHSFWYGEGTEEHHGLRFTYYTDSSLTEIVGPEFDKVACARYTEIDEGDSLWLLLRRSSKDLSTPER